jgi:hypothetical protein
MPQVKKITQAEDKNNALATERKKGIWEEQSLGGRGKNKA